uniref:Ribulose bisphosphate carboxylase/oxygenase activase AAA helical domain-containing protein n=1 Tax=Eutreptiella gymnastica TaxID=73025 RepID=A0A7S4CRT5_9EUGL
MAYIQQIGAENLSAALINGQEAPGFDIPSMTLENLVKCGKQVMEEQDNVASAAQPGLTRETAFFMGVCSGIFKGDPITSDEVATLVQTFPNQPVEFFASLRCRIYDDSLLEYIQDVGVTNLKDTLINAASPPKFEAPLTLENLVKYGQRLVDEQTDE